MNLDALKYSGNLENLADLADHPSLSFRPHADIGISRPCMLRWWNIVSGYHQLCSGMSIDRFSIRAFARTGDGRHGYFAGRSPPARPSPILQVSTDEDW